MTKENKSEGKKQYISYHRVIYADTDAMGIVYHANYVHWFEVGRTELLREAGYPYARISAEGVNLPLTKAHCEYKRPAKYDDLLEIRTTIQEMRGATITLTYEIYREADQELLVSGYTQHAITDEKLNPIRLRNKLPELYHLLNDLIAENKIEKNKRKERGE